MIFLASLTFDPALFMGWLCAGLFAGWLSSKMVEEASYGAMGDLFLGGIGGLAGGLLYALLRADAGFWGGALLALVGAGVLIGGVRTFVALRGE
jgi:uncharacterized membrane protein YeaQ/YmgE (transglycosylase-associated protein family)